jgi:ABC-type Fe3+-siderophore transport system permease subunit
VTRPNVDQIGSVASFACAIHCALTGIALGVLSSFGLGFIGHPILEFFFIGSTVTLGLWAVVRGYRTHRSWHPVALFLSGMAMIILAHENEP